MAKSPVAEYSSSPINTERPPYATLPSSVSSLSGAFPWSIQPQTDFDTLMSVGLPPWDEACRLSTLYLDQAPWFFGAVNIVTLQNEILPLWYPEAANHTSPGYTQLASSSSVTATPTRGGAHELALLFVIFCFGALTDMNLPAAPDNDLAEKYYTLTKAALTLEPILERPPSVATVQTLSLMAIYEGLKSGENSIESTWALMGMATKLAQSVCSDNCMNPDPY